MPRAPSYKTFRPSSDKASRIASKIRASDTKAEVILRSTLWRRGLRFRKNAPGFPGKPDIVFTRARVAIFCDGDFWHGRNWGKRLEKLKKGSNAAYWVAKIETNMARDRRYDNELTRLGWKVLRLWETDILSDPDGAATRVCDLLRIH